ncbi:MAG: amino acid ABC transporter ATP-binding protein [Cyanobacteria bacterium P01_H01_bin.58]
MSSTSVETIPAVRLTGLSKRFGDLTVLKDIDLTIQAGETVCLLGPSGSGKSTLMRCINWLAPPNTGDVWIHGEPVGKKLVGDRPRPMSEAGIARMRTRVSMVFQHFNLWPHRTVLENVIEAPVHVQKRPKAEVIPEAEDLLRRVGLYEKCHVYPARLSGGQKQRVAIARALAMKSDVMLLDEPTSALDPELVGEVLNVIQGLANGGMTLMITTHEMRFAEDVADRIVFMDAGRIVEVSEPDIFFKRPKTARAKQFLERYVNS